MSTDAPMRMTEVEAGERLCPMTYHGHTTYGKCCGSKCMAWRWVGKEDQKKDSEGFCGMTTQFPSR